MCHYYSYSSYYDSDQIFSLVNVLQYLDKQTLLQLLFAQLLCIKGIVQPFKRGLMGGINRQALYSSTFPQFFSLLLKDPGPLNRKKQIRAVKQLSLGQVSIKWRPLQKKAIAVCPKFDFLPQRLRTMSICKTCFSFNFQGFFT